MALIIDSTVVIAFLERLDRPELVRQLKSTYGEILVPASVVTEIEVGNQGLIDEHAANGTMAIVDVVVPEDLKRFMRRHRRMGLGESEAILTGQRLKNIGVDAKCVLDDLRARKLAKKWGIRFTGMTGLLKEFEDRGLLSHADHQEIIDRLRAAGFYMPQDSRAGAQA